MTRRLDSPEAVHRELARLLGSEPDPAIWQQLIRDGYVEDAQSLGSTAEDAIVTIDDLLHRYREFRDLVKTVTSNGAPPRRAGSTGLRLPATEAIQAEAKIAAIEAADLLAVRAFRSHILESRLLGWSEARSWLADRLEERDAWKRIHLPYVFLRSSCARANPWEAKTAVAAYEAGLQLEGFNHADSELDYLYCLCDVLIDAYQWDDDEDDVALFVLTGVPPKRSTGRFDYAPPPANADLRNGTITMQVSARMGPRELMVLYSTFRASLFDEDVRMRSVSKAVAAQAVFIAAANDGRSWTQVMKEWNEAHEDGRSYAKTRLFARDCRAAYRRVMGCELRWRGAVKRKSEPRGLQPGAEVFDEIRRELWQNIEARERRDRERKEARTRKRACKETE